MSSVESPELRPTLADVARAAGVSTATASRVLNGFPRVRPGTRKQVESAMAALGYARQRAARATAGPTGSVALVVTSPPYFAGKQYEEELQREGVPGSYLEFLQLLTDVFAECARKLEPGGRIAVNVANLGRKPYRSLSAYVIRILQDELGLLLRGELIWRKSEGASGSCAWGSYRSAANPVFFTAGTISNFSPFRLWNSNGRWANVVPQFV